jgi:hypothetical protein
MATEETFIQIVDCCTTFPSESDFSWPEKNHSRDLSIFRVFTQQVKLSRATSQETRLK